MTTKPLDEMGEDDLLDLAGERADTIRDAEADLLRIAYRWAVLHGPDRLTDDTDKPGREKGRMFGGDGTPMVCEFAVAAFAARLGITTYACRELIADALDLHHRCPDLWARVEAHQVRASYARFVVKKTRHLTPQEARYVDTAVTPWADGRIPWTRFEKRLEGAIAKANPALAREKELKAAEATFAKQLRTDAHGMASYLTRAPLWMITQIAAIVTAYSAAIRDDFPELSDDERDALAHLLLLTPSADQDTGTLTDALAAHAPTVNLYIHTYAGTGVQGDASEGVSRVEGHGPVTEDWVERLGPHCRFKIQPVIDIAGMAPVDAYEIPDRHRQAVHILTPADTYPYGSNLERTKQIDHTKAYRANGPPGQSGLGNYGPMTTPHHRIKTHGPMQVRQPFPGIYLWQDQHGATYLVDHTGTRQLKGRADDLPLIMEIYRNLPDTRLDWAA